MAEKIRRKYMPADIPGKYMGKGLFALSKGYLEEDDEEEEDINPKTKVPRGDRK